MAPRHLAGRHGEHRAGLVEGHEVLEYEEVFYRRTTVQNRDSSAFEAGFGAHPASLPAALDATIAWYRRSSEQP